jgi:hypothetical protein
VLNSYARNLPTPQRAVLIGSSQAKMQFMDDRKSKAMRDQREKVRAQAQAEARAKAERAAALTRHQHVDSPASS